MAALKVIKEDPVSIDSRELVSHGQTAISKAVT